MKKIDIGLLLPSSTTLPVAKDYETGLSEGLSICTTAGITINVLKEFIGQGGLDQTENACNKLFNYYDVDLVTGVVSNKVAGRVAEKFAIRKKQFVVSNVGGHSPDPSVLNEFIYINSVHLWQHAWTLGNWGVTQFGRKGMFLSAVYDAGYAFSQMFYLGMKAADETSDWSFCVPPMPPAGKLTDMELIFPYLEQYQPDFIFAAFCGAETELFFKAIIEHGWHKRTKILGLPFLLSPYTPIPDDVSVFTTPISKNPGWHAQSVFYHLGINAGETIAKAIMEGGSNIQSALQQLKENFSAASFFDISSQQVLAMPVMQNVLLPGHPYFESKKIANTVVYNPSTEELISLNSEISGTWLNPYLCL